jgi:hypothetical protein
MEKHPLLPKIMSFGLRYSLRSMRSMRSMRAGFIFRSRGPLQKVCHGSARMSGHNCLPGPQTDCFPGGRPHEQNEIEWYRM